MLSKQSTCSQGFTAIELIATMAIAAVLIALAVPTFTTLTSKYKVVNEISGFVGDLGYTRAEAIKEGQTVTICASTNGTTCSGSASWQSGWIVYSTNLSTAVTTVLRRQAAWKSTDTFTADNSASSVTYTSDGFTQNLPGSGLVTFTLHTSPVNNALTQCVAVNKAGRHVTQTPGTGNCS